MAGKTPASQSDLSRTMREYLAEIYRLSDREAEGADYVGTAALADQLDVSAPAVNRMITNLKKKDLLEHEPYQGIRLTETGQREALKELRLHRIVEVFLVNVMGFDWHEVHDEANRICQGLTNVVAERMATMAGNPTHCPHGEPIPSLEGILPVFEDMLLSDAPINVDLQLTRVRTREADRLEYMGALGLTPGKQFQVIHKAPFHGPLQLRINKEYRIIGHNLAELIRVQPLG